MNTTKKIAIGLGVAGGALLAAWLLTGSRKEKTKEFLSKKTSDLRNSMNKDEKVRSEESESYYI